MWWFNLLDLLLHLYTGMLLSLFLEHTTYIGFIYCDRVVVEVLKSTAAGGPSHLHVEGTSHLQIHPQTDRISLASLEDVDGCCFAQILSYHIHKVNHMWPVDLKKMYNSVLIFSLNFAWKKQRKKPDRKKTHFICLLSALFNKLAYWLRQTLSHWNGES